jgi:hypothetical protein
VNSARSSDITSRTISARACGETPTPSDRPEQPVERQRPTIAHPNLKEADAALKQAIQEPAGWSLIFVYGPTGVGKTTLRRPVEMHLNGAMMEDLGQNPGLVPVVSMEAAAPDSSQFSWKDYYRRALPALDEPLIDRKLSCNVRSSFHNVRDTFGRALTDPRAPGIELRLELESALIHRRPAAFFIDAPGEDEERPQAARSTGLDQIAAGRMVPRVSDQLGKGRQDSLCTLAVGSGRRQVLSLPPTPFALYLSALLASTASPR